MGSVRPEPACSVRVAGAWAYLDRLNVRPGDEIGVHLSTEGPSVSSLVRLGDGVLRGHPDLLPMASVDHPQALPQRVMPGSYAWIGGEPLDAPALTISVWVRPWAAPVRETLQWYAAGVLTDLDYPHSCRFGLLLDRTLAPMAYAGDGGEFRHRWSILAPRPLVRGRWHHLAVTYGEAVTLYVDGEAVATGLGRRAPAGPAARLRLGAWAEGGEAHGHLDGDLAQPIIVGRELAAREVRDIQQARGRSRPEALVDGGLLAAWPLDEECGAVIHDTSGNGRHGRLVNGAQWAIGGPAFDAATADLDTDPTTLTDNGHGIRLSSDDLLDAGWPVAATYRVPEDAPSGLYAIRVDLAGRPADDAVLAPFVVVRTTAPRSGAVLLVVPTNTWNAYGRRFDEVVVPPGLHSSFYTAHVNGTPFFEIGTRLPIPRANPLHADSERAQRQGHIQLVRPEWIAQAWLRQQGFALECVTDLELHRGDVELHDFACVVLAGHSEYWSIEMRRRMEAYLGSGGCLVSLSGDTASQRVVIARDGSSIQARKIHESDPLWLTPERWGERWHPCGEGPGGRFRSIGMPSWDFLGVSTKGMIDDGLPASFAPLDVLAPDHFLFHEPERVPIGADGVIGRSSINGPAISGYEFDATPDVTGFRDDPLPGLVVLARARSQDNFGHIGAPIASGADAVHWERPDGGRVFTISSIGATGSLPADAGVAALVRNALHHMGATRVGHAGH